MQVGLVSIEMCFQTLINIQPVIGNEFCFEFTYISI